MKAQRKISKRRRVFNLIALLIVPVLFYSCVDSMIFFPPTPSYRASSNLVEIPVENGRQIAAYYLPAEDGEFVVLFSHGNAEDIGQNRGFFQQYRLEGFGILGYDYQGYGLSDGKPSEQNTYRDIAAAYGFLVNEHKIDPQKIIVHGRSVGSGPSVWLTTQEPVGGLILESPFVSAFRVHTRWPILPFDKYNNLRRIQDIDCPLLVIHGQNDRVVAPWHGQKIYDTAAGPKMHYWIPRAGHNNLLNAAGADYWKNLDDFKNMIEQHQETHGEQ